MKKIILILAASLTILTARSQVIAGDVNVNDLDITLCELQVIRKAMSMSGKVTIAVDYGQEPGKFIGVTDTAGKLITFNGIIEALNYMEKNGWQYLNNYESSENSNMITHFLFRKKGATTVPKE